MHFGGARLPNGPIILTKPADVSKPRTWLLQYARGAAYNGWHRGGRHAGNADTISRKSRC
jgi:hypothetical protein